MGLFGGSEEVFFGGIKLVRKVVCKILLILSKGMLMMERDEEDEPDSTVFDYSGFDDDDDDESVNYNYAPFDYDTYQVSISSTFYTCIFCKKVLFIAVL